MTNINMRQYPEIARFLVDRLENGSLSDELLEEIGTAQADLNWPMRKAVITKDKEVWQKIIAGLITSKNEHKRLVGARLTATGLVSEEEGLYKMLKKWFQSINAQNERKILIGLHMFFFEAYKSDIDFQLILEDFFTKNIDMVLKFVKRYFGGIENARLVLENSMTDGARQNPWLSELVLNKLR